MKKVLIGLVVLVALLGGGAYLIYSNLDKIVESAIEQAGTNAVGSEVAVDSVELNLPAGQVSIFGFSVANPAGFTPADMVSFEELSINIDVQSLQSDVIRIDSIVARQPYVRYESTDGGSNVDAVSSRFSSDETEAVEESTEPGQQLSIGSIVIEDIQGTLIAELLPTDLEVDLGDINLQDLNGTPEEIAKQVMGPLLSQISSSAGEALLSSMGDLIGDDIQAQAEEALEGVQSQVEEALDENLGEGLREGLGNLLDR